jgi:hypothetical protein
MTKGGYPSVSYCVCIYEPDKLPPSSSIPEYVTRSPPKFTIIDASNKMALGVDTGYDCTVDAIDVATQNPTNSTRLEFRLSHDSKLVSVACPQKILTADCSKGSMKLVNPIFPIVSHQQWIFNDNGNIVSAACSNLKVSSLQESPKTIDSFYFSMMNPATGMAMGIASDRCEEGAAVTLQKVVLGNPAQQFVKRDDGAIISLMCPNMALAVVEEENPLSAGKVKVMQHENCEGEGVSIKLDLVTGDLASAKPYSWTFNDDSSIESTFTCPGKVIDVKTGGKLSAVAGALLGVGNHTQDTFSIYQRWTKTHQKLSILSGPHSLVNADNKALSVGDAKCADGMQLRLSPDDSRSSAEQFYLGNGGTIFSSKCPGLVITAPPNCQQDIVLTLKTATGDDNTKWNFDAFRGSISSVTCPELVVIGNVLKPSSSPVMQKWRTVNTRLLPASEQGWNQNWEVIFAEQYDNVLPQAYGNQPGRKCYNASDAYSASFDAFSLDLIINDATDEDQCQNTREMLGFDRDYPFDLEVRDEYHNLMCQGVEFTAVDHLTSGLSEPPVFEEVEFEAPEYTDDPELTFETLSTHTFAWPEAGLYYKGTRQGYDTIGDIGQSIVTLTFTAKYAEMAYEYAKKNGDSICNAQPDFFCVAVIAGNGGCIPIPVKSACEAAKNGLTDLFFALWKIAELTVDTLEHAMYIVSQ